VRQQLGLLMDKSDLIWRQHAKMNWLENGDRNMKFFHACANFRKKSNFIASISDTVGRYWDKPEEVQLAFFNYFHNLFTSEIAGDLQNCVENLSC
jgi:hypothetical protein